MRHFLLVFAIIIFTSKLFAQEYYTGLIFDDELYDKSTTLPSQSVLSFENLPPSTSLKKYCPRAGNQIRFGTSVGWAAAWGARTILEARKNSWSDPDFITRNAFSPIFAYQMSRREGDEHCSIGSKMEEVLSKMKYTGAVKYVDYLEFCPDELPGDVLIKAKSNRISEYNKLFELDDKQADRIKSVKKSLSQGFPVVVGMYCPPSFLKAEEFWQPLEVITNEMPGHAVCVVGYDDQKLGGAFEVLNSWGKNWGKSGFTWIRYEDFSDYVKYAYELILLETSENSAPMFGTVEVVNPDMRVISTSLKNDGFYELQYSFQIGDRFKIDIKNSSRGYFYVIGSGEGNDFSLLFPHDKETSAALVYEGNYLSIPDEEHFIQVTGDERQDYLFLIFSRVPLDINYHVGRMQNESGNSREIMARIFGNQMIDQRNINWENWEMSFKAQAQVDEVAIMTILFKRY